VNVPYSLFAKKQENSKRLAENKQKVQGVGFEPPVGWRHRQFSLFYAATFSFFGNSINGGPKGLKTSEIYNLVSFPEMTSNII